MERRLKFYSVTNGSVVINSRLGTARFPIVAKRERERKKEVYFKFNEKNEREELHTTVEKVNSSCSLDDTIDERLILPVILIYNGNLQDRAAVRDQTIRESEKIDVDNLRDLYFRVVNLDFFFFFFSLVFSSA
ncbi:hypothetical protein PUN28_019983 [Cardiocondyla obscurior]|uniref:Uncharacterized protein n=1 Tax=Cardiocondyla obscurior TaxID=286306 RepID=A0AAW2E9M8_9HYME